MLFDEEGNFYKVITVFSYSLGYVLYMVSFDPAGQLRWERAFDSRSPLVSLRWAGMVYNQGALYLLGSDTYATMLVKLDASSGAMEWLVPVDWGRGGLEGTQPVSLLAAGEQVYLVVDRGEWQYDCDNEGECDWTFYPTFRRLLRYGSDGRWRAQFVPPHGMWASRGLMFDGERVWWMSGVSSMGGHDVVFTSTGGSCG